MGVLSRRICAPWRCVCGVLAMLLAVVWLGGMANAHVASRYTHVAGQEVWSQSGKVSQQPEGVAQPRTTEQQDGGSRTPASPNSRAPHAQKPHHCNTALANCNALCAQSYALHRVAETYQTCLNNCKIGYTFCE